MSNGSTAVEALQAECDAAIADIKSREGVAKCDAHDAVCRGLVTLLRCQRAQLGQSLWWGQLLAASAVSAAVGAIVGRLLG